VEFFWRDNRLQIEPSNENEKIALLLLSAKGGIRQTSSVSGECFNKGDFVLEIVTAKVAAQKWKSSVPALPGVEITGWSKRDSERNAIALALREISDRMVADKLVPDQVERWFATFPAEDLSYKDGRVESGTAKSSQ
jgi:hypothetical protein